MEMYFNRIDEVMASEQMPAEYDRYRSEVFCSDCERKSTTKFHFIYHKCQYSDCKSYNTKVVKTWELGEGEIEVEVVHDISTPRAPRLNHFREVDEMEEDPQIEEQEAIEAQLENFVMEE